MDSENGLLTVRLEGKDVFPARIICGVTDAFSSPKFVLLKPRWMSDNEAHTCHNCEAKFTQIRRRHHCRQCGKISCGNCCKDKIALPQLGIEVPERVCSSCFSVCDLVTKSRASQVHSRIEAAKILAEYTEDPQMVSKLVIPDIHLLSHTFQPRDLSKIRTAPLSAIVVEFGGVQALIALSNMDNKKIQSEVLKGLHRLSMHQPLHNYLTVSGAVKAASHVLENASSNDRELLLNGINSLYLLCKTPELRTKVLHDGALSSVLKLCKMEDTIALVAMQALNLIVEDHQTHSIIVDSQRVQALPHILSLCTRKEHQMQLVSLKILAHISTSSDWNRHRIIQEDFASGENLKGIFENFSANTEVLCNAVCLLANLATSSIDQNGLLTFQNSLCSLLSGDHSNKILFHIIRGIANFSKFKLNAPILMQVFPTIITKGLMSEDDRLRSQAVRVTAYLLAYMPEQTNEHLQREGVSQFLLGLSSLPQFTGCLENLFSHSYPQLSPPS